jgi:hypothetical protein
MLPSRRCAAACRSSRTCSIVLLATAPLLRDGLVHVQDVRRDVVQVLLLHGSHLWPDVSATNGGVHLRDVLKAVIGGGVVLVVDKALNGVARRLGTAQLLCGQADILVCASASTDVAGGARCQEKALATDEPFLVIDDRAGHPRKGPAKQCRSTEIRELDPGWLKPFVPASSERRSCTLRINHITQRHSRSVSCNTAGLKPVAIRVLCASVQTRVSHLPIHRSLTVNAVSPS